MDTYISTIFSTNMGTYISTIFSTDVDTYMPTHGSAIKYT